MAKRENGQWSVNDCCFKVENTFNMLTNINNWTDGTELPVQYCRNPANLQKNYCHNKYDKFDSPEK